MKNNFLGYYEPTKEQTDISWEAGVFAFDANTLLNLYRYTEETRKDFLSALIALKDRIYLPYQSAVEYHRTRRSLIESNLNAYQKVEESFVSAMEKALGSELEKHKKHPSISVEKLTKLKNEFVIKLKKELAKQRSLHPDFKQQDVVFEQLSVLFENCCGLKPVEADLKAIYDIGKDRYQRLIPPGYMDAKKAEADKSKDVFNENSEYGDLLIWEDIISFCTTAKRPMIFITDDRKEDWWLKVDGKTVSPRPELIQEFYDRTEIRILIYNADQFLKFAKERNIVTSLHDDSIREIKEIRTFDEDITYTTSAIYRKYNPKPYNSAISKMFSSKPVVSSEDLYNVYKNRIVKMMPPLGNLSDEKLDELLEVLTFDDFRNMNSRNHSELNDLLATDDRTYDIASRKTDEDRDF
ncbi:MAG: hypothetical protein EOO20_09240 [Chryseobacterium sp.]|nr:MAG: hypothetical protein EOO20_09240 [Chryseobacterium sp.]